MRLASFDGADANVITRFVALLWSVAPRARLLPDFCPGDDAPDAAEAFEVRARLLG